MTKTYAIWQLLGVTLMAWRAARRQGRHDRLRGGASITWRLQLSGRHTANVALFALGIIFLSQAPYHSLAARLRRLESELRRVDPLSDASRLGD
jgi:hypothetical protein